MEEVIKNDDRRVISDEELIERVQEAENAGLLLCMTDCEVVKIEKESDGTI